MSFVTLAYVVFLVCTVCAYFVLPKVVRPFLLLVCSYLFYLYDPKNAGFVVLLLAMTAITYFAGLQLARISPKKVKARRFTLTLAIVICFGALIYYKYTGLLLGLFGSEKSWSIAQPLGISFFLFQAVGYLIDVYRDKQKAERNFLYYALFVSFSPCIVAGPIERAGNMLPQFKALQSFDYERVSGGAFRILWGCFKKLVIANTLYTALAAVIGNMDNYNGTMLFLAILVFSYYLYCDFSALSDIAIGSAALFGFTVMENFKRPLAATSFGDLWRRWHISLSNWFRDYLYFPLGGNRKGKLRAHLNQIIVFTVSGLWHGASVGFLIWGALNGLFLIIGKETAELRQKMYRYNPLYAWKPLRSFIQMVITYVIFSICFSFFCTELFGTPGKGLSDAIYLLSNLFSDWSFALVGTKLAALGISGLAGWVLFGSILLVECFEYLQIPVHVLIRKMPVVLRWPLYYSLLITMYFYGSFGVSAFVYQQY